MVACLRLQLDKEMLNEEGLERERVERCLKILLTRLLSLRSQLNEKEMQLNQEGLERQQVKQRVYT